MKRNLLILAILILLFCPNSYAGFSKSYYTNASDNLAVAVLVKDKGIYNLCVSVTIVSRPTEQSVYESDEYEKLIERLRVQWQDLAANKILEFGELEIKDLIKLKKSINTEIINLSERLKTELLPGKNAEIVFSISDFFLLEPKI